MEPCNHEFVEVSAAFAGRFCRYCNADEDDLDANPHEIVPRGVSLS